MSLAVRHRPRRLADVAGQRTVVDVLGALTTRRPVPQQILLAGPSGVGKTTLARIFAAALFCPSPVAGDACGSCPSCTDVTGPGGRHPDVIEIDAASHGGVDQIRALADEAHLSPMVADWRVYIIDEAHGLTRDGGQAFLRLLEEPPPHTLFILATTDPHKLTQALRSRCVACYVTAPERGDLVANLGRVAAAEGWAVPAAVLELVVDASDADLGVRGTVTNLEKLAAAASAGNLTPASAAHLLGVADPAAFSRLTAAVAAGDRRAAVAALLDVTGQAPEPLVRAQLVRWAHTEVRSRSTSGGDLDASVWWLDQLTSGQQLPLPVTIARMCAPQLAGAEALATLTARAEAAADRLAAGLASVAGGAQRPATSPATATTPGGPATAATAQSPARPRRTAADPGATTAPAGAPVAAPVAATGTVARRTAPATEPGPPAMSPAPAAVPVGPGDPDLVAILNELARAGAGRSALWLRGARATRTGTAWTIYDADPSHTDPLREAAATLGWQVTFA